MTKQPKSLEAMEIEANLMVQNVAADIWSHARMRGDERISGQAMDSDAQIKVIVRAINMAAGYYAAQALASLQPVDKLREELAKTKGKLAEARSIINAERIGNARADKNN